MPLHHRPAVLHFAGRAGDRNGNAYLAGARLAAAWGPEVTTIGTPAPALGHGWAEELVAATPELQLLAERLGETLSAGRTPLIALGRCAASLATLPVLADRYPGAAVVWFDAHGDLHTPDTTGSGYLGGLTLAGALGWWDSGLGAGVDPADVLLVGARALDPAEQDLIEAGVITRLPVSASLAADLGAWVAGRPVVVHVDCDVLEPGTVPVELPVPAGLSLDQLHDCAVVLAVGDVVAVQVAELELHDPPDDDAGAAVRRLTAALAPLLGDPG